MARATFGITRVWICGFYTHRGVVTAAKGWGEAQADVKLLPALPESYEGQLHVLQEGSNEALSFSTSIPDCSESANQHPLVPKLSALLSGPPLLQRWVGVVYRPDSDRASHYGVLKLRDCYDQVIFVDNTSALLPPPLRPLPSDGGGGAFVSRASTQRLIKELQRLRASPPPGISAKPLESNLLEWHFLLRFPAEGSGAYAGGEYHGSLVFPLEYPMAPPAFRVFTPNGRFEPGVRLCLSMSDYHPESWNPGWSVETMLVGLQSFMNEESDAIGSIRASAEERRRLAQASRAFNAQNALFCELFLDGSTQPASSGDDGRGDVTSSSSASVCRFCFSSEGELISPCMCRGSNEWVHLSCLKAWQKAVVLMQPTHPKYQTKIDEICSVCCEPFSGPGILPRGSARHAQILEYVGGAEIAALVAPGNFLVSTRESSRENLELAAAHPEIRERLATWTRAVFLMLNVGKGGDLVAVSTSQALPRGPPSDALSQKELARWAALEADAARAKKGLQVRHFDGGPLGRNSPITIAHFPSLLLGSKALLPHGLQLCPPAWVYGVFEAVAAAAVKEGGEVMNGGAAEASQLSPRERSITLNVVWGYGGWGGTQILAEIGRGGWGLVSLDMFLSNRPEGAPSEPSWELDFEWSRMVSYARLPPRTEYMKRR